MTQAGLLLDNKAVKPQGSQPRARCRQSPGVLIEKRPFADHYGVTISKSGAYDPPSAELGIKSNVNREHSMSL
jgi:hypothetical protein